MRIAIVAAGAILIALPSPAHTIMGAGVTSCGKWTENHQGGESSGLQDFQNEWVLGFITALNDVRRGSDLVSGMDSSGLVAWITNYCVTHPLDSVATATNALALELQRRADQNGRNSN